MGEASFWTRFVLALLATWRVTHLLASEDGPADIIFRIRASMGQSIFGKLMDCFNCLSLWIAALAAIFVSRGWLEWILCWLALSGGACLLERIGKRPAEGDFNDVLQSEALRIEEDSSAKYDAEHLPPRVRHQ